MKKTAVLPPAMADFIFGGIEADERRLLETERDRWTGLRHFHDITPLDPLPGQSVTVTASVGPDVPVDRVTAYMTTDGSDPSGAHGVAEQGMALPLQRVDTRWVPLIWDYVEVWQGELPGQPDGTLVQYRIEGWSSVDADVSVWSREQQMDGSAEQPTRYGYHVDRFTPPDWAHEAVIYQVFVDRFAGIEGGWLAADRLAAFAGGTLRGIIDKLDHIVDLGATAIWLSPFFQTSSYHGYDVIDYSQVDARFGTRADVRELVRAAHQRGLRVILDFVANHVSTEFAPFADAQNDPDSPYREWFSFEPAYKHGYRSFFDVASMPQLNTDHPDVCRYLINAAQYWLREFDVDGYRLDYAAGPSHVFWSEFRAACRAVKADCVLFGEVTRAGETLRTYTGRLDGCLDFAFCRSVRQLCAAPESAISLTQFANTMQRSRRYFGDKFLLSSFIDNHDMNRFLYVAGDDVRRLQLALGLLFTLGETPILYYGTEVGLSQPRAKAPYREESRHPMRWGDEKDLDLLEACKAWIALRRSHPALIHGDLTTLFIDDEQGLWVFERQYGDDRVRCGVNLGQRTGSVAEYGLQQLPPLSATIQLNRHA